ncbi:MAG: hypothetical protein ACRDH2_09675, partial [Anaerolineales bacterium]
MKEQILHLDPHDDYHSARDKMGWTQTQRVLLVWPKHGRVPLRRLDLLLLHRHAHRLGAHLGLVTHDSEVREHARSLGLPVFASIEASRQMRWRSRPVRMRPERLHPTPHVSVAALKPTPLQLPPAPPWVVWVFKSLVFVLGLGALALLAYALIPSATVTLAPAIQPLQTTVEIVADPNLPQVESGGLIPARTVRVEIGP